MLLLVISFYLKLCELDKSHSNKTLRREIDRRRIPVFLLIASILLFAFFFVTDATTGNYLEINGNYLYLPYSSVLLGLISVLLKLNFVEKVINEPFETSRREQ